MKQKIIAVDPGTRNLGVAIFNRRRYIQLVHAKVYDLGGQAAGGVILTKAIVNIMKWYKEVYKLEVDSIFIEDQNMGMARTNPQNQGVAWAAMAALTCLFPEAEAKFISSKEKFALYRKEFKSEKIQVIHGATGRGKTKDRAYALAKYVLKEEHCAYQLKWQHPALTNHIADLVGMVIAHVRRNSALPLSP